MHWESDHTRLIGEGPHNSVTNPPGGIGREARSPLRLEFLGGPHESEVSLLDEVRQGESAIEIAACNLYHEAKVRLDQPGPSFLIAGLNAAGEGDFLVA